MLSFKIVSACSAIDFQASVRVSWTNNHQAPLISKLLLLSWQKIADNIRRAEGIEWARDRMASVVLPVGSVNNGYIAWDQLQWRGRGIPITQFIPCLSSVCKISLNFSRTEESLSTVFWRLLKMPGSTMPSASESAIVSQLRERIAPGRKRGISHFNSK